MKYVKYPNLPVNAKTVILSKQVHPTILDELQKLNISYIFSEKNEKILNPIAYHPDMSITHLGEDNFLVCPNMYNHYKSIGNVKIGVDISKEYPNDIAYNCAFVGNYVLHHEKYAQVPVRHTNQGYTKCNVCVVYKNAIITQDASIHSSCKDIDCLLIENDNIILNGMNYGFIGGASGKLKSDLLAFTGDITKHKNYQDIKSFCQNFGVDVISLSNIPLTDYGSIIPIYEH